MRAVSEDDVLFSKEYITPVCLAMRVSTAIVCMYLCV